jgi:hypothetical protein
MPAKLAAQNHLATRVEDTQKPRADIAEEHPRELNRIVHSQEVSHSNNRLHLSVRAILHSQRNSPETIDSSHLTQATQPLGT